MTLTPAEAKALAAMAAEPSGQALVGSRAAYVATVSRRVAHVLDVLGYARRVNESWVEITEAGRAQVEHMDSERIHRAAEAARRRA